MDIKVGDTVYGNNKEEQYKIIAPIGNGSFGIVFEAHDNNENRYAVKTIITAFLNTNSFRSLVNEGNLAVEVHHKNVLNVIFFHDGTKYPDLPPYMILEYADGGTLEDLINERRTLKKFFSKDETYDLFVNLSQGMKAINETLVHRDVKPDNILFVNGIPKIADFGLSKVVGATTRSSTFKGINHIKYCAPEAWRIEGNTPAMDMYSMGIIFYEIATLTYPYKVSLTGDIIEVFKNAHLVSVPQNPKVINSALDNNISQVIMKMIEKQPANRYSSWDEIINRLEAPGNIIENNLAEGVSTLVQKAMEKRREAELLRLKAEEERQVIDENEAIIEYCFNQIMDSAKGLIDQFNESSDFAQLAVEINEYNRFTFNIRAKNPGRGRVVVSIIPIYEEHYMDTNRIKAWGFAKAPSGKGFNLFLIITKPDDLYGEWFTLQASHNAIARHTDNRKPPFPFELDELPREIKLIRSMHIYNTDINGFDSNIFIPLLEELI